jgi:hypothetical protein
MDSRNPTDNQYIIKEQRVKGILYADSYPIKDFVSNPAFEKFAVEGRESFFNYIDWLGLANDPDLIILPSTNHFFYDAEDLKEVKTIINLRMLNRIKQIKEFLHTIYHVVPNKCYFLGFFIDRKSQPSLLSYKNKVQDKITGNIDPVKNGITSRIPFINMMYNILDSRFNRSMTKRTVTLLLEDAGLKVLDITELNGLTYFCSQKVNPS